MNQHTPGPWEAISDECKYAGIDGANDQTVIIFGDDNDDGGIRGATPEEAQANARLIAASPEAYAILADLDRMMEIDSLTDDDGRYLELPEGVGIHARIQVYLAKVRGE